MRARKKFWLGANHHCPVTAQYSNRICRRDRSSPICVYTLLVRDSLEGANVRVI